MDRYTERNNSSIRKTWIRTAGGFTYTLKKSSRKTISLQIDNDMSIVVRAPFRCPMYEADRFVTDHKDWINKHMTLVQKRLKKKKEVRHLEKDETDLLFSDAMKDIPARVEHFAPVIGVTYGRITIRNQKTRWGSCSQKGNLNFNAALMLCPEDCRDYVVVHELCHRKEMNHSKAFWKLVEEVIPDYRAKERYLKEHSEFIEMIT